MTLNQTWQRNLANIRKRLRLEGPADFLTWPSVHSGMFVGDAPQVKPRFDYLMSRDPRFWRAVMIEPGIGNPPRLSYANWTSGQLVNQAFHINQWMEKTGKRVSSLNTIFEFGAGYGAMALICQRLGFNGRYIILDLDEPMMLQKHYLDELGIDHEHIELYQYVECDLFISICALSEVSEEIKNAVLRKICSVNDPGWPEYDGFYASCLVVFQHLWNNFDNKKYFSQWLDVHKHKLCRHWYGIK